MPASRDVLLLANLGTPSAPTAEAVSRYLGEFLADPRVVQLPRLFWLPLLRLVVLPLRSRRVAHNYAEIWMDGGSPLEVHTRRLAAAVQPLMPGVHVEHVMRYGEPALTRRLRELRAGGARVLVLPVYPQYSTTTTASVADVIGRELPAARMIEDYHVDPGWVDAVAGSIRRHWDQHGRGQRLLFSFHGIPQRLVDKGDPYERQCHASAQAIAAALGLGEGEWQLTFQSRFGGGKWLSPATDATVRALPAEGIRRIDVVCPGFSADCLETLEEISMQNAEFFREAGGETLSYIPCLNDDPAHARAIAALAQREFAAWA
ncbi:ferrochelatase [Luteimonas sp. MC1750]|uniref:ferrochelatase n=1 Tax=Luteimonas sp. MC1750 TaxID=2799326 RepID=UPI0018F0E415|nr:ferrochelatase [Luteimonas sp. MC1750]MBJ6985175.1 ferrochelatase [Luteimonas sp. MC1750]QQO05829.1 ferrochelatase [Luteimonas sp. MC1750]